MQGLGKILQEYCTNAVKQLYGIDIAAESIVINETKPEFKGHYTLVTFALSKQLKKAPAQIASDIGEALMQNKETFAAYETIQGFLNISFTPQVIAAQLQHELTGQLKADSNGQKVMVEFASPNTNKPLHLGHLRNVFLGDSISRILKDAGYDVVRANLINDRGIHICKSMYAWQLLANGATPASTGIKGDHFVGDYYVKFETILKEELAQLEAQVAAGDFSAIASTALPEIEKLIAARDAASDDTKRGEINAKLKEQLKLHTPCMKGAQAMLIQWEQKDEAIINLWSTMNGWVYEGFEKTYAQLGIAFDAYYYESNTYLLGKEVVQHGLDKKVFFQREDSSVWINLTEDGYDEKLLLRSNGTSVYITQDIGTAILKYNDHKIDQSIYVIADEQNYHMQVLKLIMQKLQQPGADGIYHLSYGMVELPHGKMKSREGTVVDADDIAQEMIDTAAARTKELGKTDGFDEAALQTLYNVLGIGALKFYLIRVEPKRRMVFNPEEGVDFHGFTGPFVQYACARISSILRKQQPSSHTVQLQSPLLPLEEKLILQLSQFEAARSAAVQQYNPSEIALYVYNLAKVFNGFVAEHKVIAAESDEKRELRLQLCATTLRVLKHGMQLLGCDVPEKM